MLVLSRKEGERIRVGSAWISVERIGRDKVRIGIDADDSVQVVREEILYRNEEVRKPRDQVAA